MRAVRTTALAVMLTGAIGLGVAPAQAHTSGSDDQGTAQPAKGKAKSKAAEKAAKKAALAKAAAQQRALAESLRTQATAQVAAAEKALKDAERSARTLRRKATAVQTLADQARRDLGNMARAAYATGGTDLLTLAALIDTNDPMAVIQRAEVARMVAEHQDDQSDQAAILAGRAGQLSTQADKLLAAARTQLKAARALYAAVQDPASFTGTLTTAIGSGSQQLTDRCLAVDVPLPICAAPAWSEEHLTYDSVVVMRTTHVLWPQIGIVGGWRPSDPYPDHPSGRAVDIMMPDNGHSESDVKLGYEIAKYFQQHAAQYGISYMIWRQQTWTTDMPVGQWRGMSDRGDWTSNHMDHVHITVRTGNSGTAFEALVLQAQNAAADLLD